MAFCLGIRRHLNGGQRARPATFFCLSVPGVQTVFALDELLWARLIFALGAVVTAATVVMIVRGHLYWNRRGSTDVR